MGPKKLGAFLGQLTIPEYVCIIPNILILSAGKKNRTDPTLKRAKETMRTLLAKYPDGYEGWAKEKGEEPVHRVYSPTSYEFLSNFGSNPGTATQIAV